MLMKKWSKGERVVHAARPEWGQGEILQVDPATQDGKPCQRLVVKFDRAGTKTVSTAFAELKPATGISTFAVAAAREIANLPAPGAPSSRGTTVEPANDPLSGGMTKGEIEQQMLRLPENSTDPFLTLEKRLKATLDQYRFGETPGGLLDWAAVQTGLKDPMTRFNRHELEQFFVRYRMVLDGQLRRLLKEARRAEPRLAETLGASACASAKQAIRRADVDR